MPESVSTAVPALDKAMSLLRFLAERKKEYTLTELCRETSLPKSSAHTILAALEAHGLVTKRENRYGLGISLYAMGCIALDRYISISEYRPLLEKLRDQTGCTVHLCMYDACCLTIIDKLDGIGGVQFKAFKGERKRLNTSASGKAIAAYLSEKELQCVLANGFDHLTCNSIQSEEHFRKQLEWTREYGFSIDDGEGELGVRCLGIPIFFGDGKVLGAISITTLQPLLPVESIPDKAVLLLEAGKAFSRILNCSVPYPSFEINPERVRSYFDKIHTGTPT